MIPTEVGGIAAQMSGRGRRNSTNTDGAQVTRWRIAGSICVVPTRNRVLRIIAEAKPRKVDQPRSAGRPA